MKIESETIKAAIRSYIKRWKYVNADEALQIAIDVIEIEETKEAIKILEESK